MTEPKVEDPFAPPAAHEIPVTVDGEVNFERLQTVGIGLGLVYLSLLLLVVTLLIGGAGGYVATGMGWGSVLMSIIGLIAVGIVVLSFIGTCLCTTVPSETGAKGFVIASLVPQAIQVVGGVAGMAFGIAMGAMEVLLLGVPSVLLFVVFLRKLSLFIRRPDFARRAMVILTVMLFIIVGGGIFVAQPQFVAPTGFPGPGIFAAPLLIGLPSLLLFVMYANLVNELGRTIRRSGRGRKAKHLG